MYKFSLLIMFVSSMVFASDESAFQNASRQLGDIIFMENIGNDWVFIEGSKDSFILTKNGRFSISAHGDKLVLMDLWDQKKYPFSLLKQRRNSYPLKNTIGDEGKYMFFNYGNKSPAATIFTLVGDPKSSRFMKKNGRYLRDKGTRVIPLPMIQDGESQDDSVERWTRFWCAPDLEKKEYLENERYSGVRGVGCDDAAAIKQAAANLALLKTLGIQRVPFVIRTQDEKGQVMEGSVRGFIR